MPVTADVNSSGLSSNSRFNFLNLNKKFDLNVKIISGRYQGAQISFPSDVTKPISVGNSVNDDVVLLGADIKKEHFKVRFGSYLSNKITLIANNGPIKLDDGQVVNIGEWVELTLPAKVSFGENSIKFEREYGMSKVNSLAKPAILLLCSLLVGTIGAIFISSQNNFYEITKNTSIIQNEQPIVAGSLNQLENASSTASLIREQILKMQLENFLSVIENSDGTVLVSGIIPEELLGQWRSVLQWYDGQKNMSHLVNNVSSRKGDDFELSIQSVWMDGNNRVVIFSDGNMARIGDTIKGGWVIKDIITDHIVIGRNKQTIKINY